MREARKIVLDLRMFDAGVQTTALSAPGNDLSPEVKTYYDKLLIVSAQPQPEQPVVILILRRQKQNRQVRRLPEPPKQGKAVPVRQHDIKNRHIRLLLPETLHRFLYIFCRDDAGVAAVPQSIPDHHEQFPVIVNQQDFSVIYIHTFRPPEFVCLIKCANMPLTVLYHFFRRKTLCLP